MTPMGYLRIGLLVLVLALVGGLYVSREEVHALSVDLKTANDNTARVASVNTVNQSTITDLQAAVKVWKDKATAEPAALDAAVKAQADTHAIELRSVKLTTHEETDHALATCDAILSADIAALCPAHAASVRERAAASDLSGSSGKGGGADSAANTSGPYGRLPARHQRPAVRVVDGGGLPESVIRSGRRASYLQGERGPAQGVGGFSASHLSASTTTFGTGLPSQ